MQLTPDELISELKARLAAAQAEELAAEADA
jgi:hypothetical protein